MLRLFTALIVFVAWTAAAVAQATPPLARGLEAVRAGDFDAAQAHVRRAGPVARDVIEWHRLRAGQGDARDVLAFLERRGDWPGLPLLRRKSEAAFEAAGDRRILAFFEGDEPQTARGALIHASALQRAGRGAEAEASVIAAWRSFDMGPEDHARYLDAHGSLLKPHHEARLDFLLWQGEEASARRMLPLVSSGWQRLAEARLGLRADQRGVDGLIEAVPAALRDHPGLAYERFLWRLRKGREASARELILAQSRASALGEPEKWSGWRRRLAREDMRAGNYTRAYELASQHGLSLGSAYADLEWLSGYLAVRYLDRPRVALQHFLRFEQAVETPISLGRAGYWIGRAYEAMGERENAQRAYAGGGVHQTSFYGLLAAEKAGLSVDPSLAGKERFPSWRQAGFTRTSVHEAATQLLAAGEPALAERFWLHLAESQERQGLGQMGQMAEALGQPHIAVMLGKRMVRQGVTLPGPYYALHPLAKRRLPVPTEMALAIARRESEFDPTVISGAGARGLMQLMPKTAQQVSRELSLPYARARLTADPDYNVTLGSAYLAELAKEFDGNVILVSAGYNAGPSRPTRWMKERGDPRRGSVEDMIDWIEHIPFNETRNYVMRVAESLPVYRARLGKDALPQPFSREITSSSWQADR